MGNTTNIKSLNARTTSIKRTNQKGINAKKTSSERRIIMMPNTTQNAKVQGMKKRSTMISGTKNSSTTSQITTTKSMKLSTTANTKGKNMKKEALRKYYDTK